MKLDRTTKKIILSCLAIVAAGLAVWIVVELLTPADKRVSPSGEATEIEAANGAAALVED